MIAERTEKRTFASVMRKALPRSLRLRRHRSQANATLAWVDSIPEEAVSSRRGPSSTFCCTPPPVSGATTRSESNASTLSISSSYRSSLRSSNSSFVSSPSASQSSTRSSYCHSQSSTQLNLRTQGWMFWARRNEDHFGRNERRNQSPMAPVGDCFTKVYAVLRNEFLLLYRTKHKTSVGPMAAETPLVQIAVSRVTRSISGAFLVQDPNGEEMELYLYDRSDVAKADRWVEALEQAAVLTELHFITFDVKVDELPRHSMYRGSLYDLRMQKRTFRESLKSKLTKLASYRPFASSHDTRWIDSECEVSI